MNLLLSIVIPVYNLETMIARCLDSLLRQDIDLSQYEIICVDDGSTDESPRLLDEYAEKYSNIVVVHKSNEGVVKTRNAGLRIAKGDYIWFVDGDDWVQSNCFAYLMHAVEINDADLMLFRMKRVYNYHEDSIILSDYAVRPYRGGYNDFADYYSTGTGFWWFKREVLNKYSIFFREDIYYSDDTLFLAKYKARCKNMVLVDAPIYYYYQRSDSVSHAVRNSQHAGCMYKLAKEYSVLKKTSFPLNTKQTQARFQNAQIRAMQICLRNICLFCRDRSFMKWFLQKSREEKMYPFGIDWGNFRIDRKQSRKADILNWMFACVSFRPYLWLCWSVCGVIRKKNGLPTFNSQDFEDTDLNLSMANSKEP